MVSNQDPELSPDARRIIADARGFDDPTPEDQDRVRTRWLASIAAVAGVSSLTEAVRAASGIGWGVKAIGAALAVAVGAGGLYAAFHSDAPNAALSEAAPDPVAAPGEAVRGTELPGEMGGVGVVDGRTADGAAVEGPSVTMVDAPALPAVDAMGALPVAQTAAPASARPSAGPKHAPAGPSNRASGSGTRVRAQGAAAERPLPPARASSDDIEAGGKSVQEKAAAPSGQLGEELLMLSQIRRSVQEGAPARALELISEYRGRFARPILGMEADALRVDSLCRTGQREAAQASISAFRNDWPGSPLEQRVSSACP